MLVLVLVLEPEPAAGPEPTRALERLGLAATTTAAAVGVRRGG